MIVTNLIQHCFQETDLDLYGQFNQDSTNGRALGQRSGDQRFESQPRLEFTS